MEMWQYWKQIAEQKARVYYQETGGFYNGYDKETQIDNWRWYDQEERRIRNELKSA